MKIVIIIMNVDVIVCNINRKCILKNIWIIVMCNELLKFMIKKYFLFFCLIKYGDILEMYVVWKLSFKNVLFEFGILLRGEENLLVKWFGFNLLY